KFAPLLSTKICASIILLHIYLYFFYTRACSKNVIVLDHVDPILRMLLFAKLHACWFPLNGISKKILLTLDIFFDLGDIRYSNIHLTQEEDLPKRGTFILIETLIGT
ncbi:hypothetical protein ACJX0J_015587, partial [Zea mays]